VVVAVAVAAAKEREEKLVCSVVRVVWVVRVV
jgi:hypothetical protein